MNKKGKLKVNLNFHKLTQKQELYYNHSNYWGTIYATVDYGFKWLP